MSPPPPIIIYIIVPPLSSRFSSPQWLPFRRCISLSLRLLDPTSFGVLLPLKKSVKEHLRSNYSRRDCLQTQFVVRLLADRIINTTHDLFYFEDFFCDLTRHNIAVITIVNVYKHFVIFHHRSYQNIFYHSLY